MQVNALSSSGSFTLEARVFSYVNELHLARDNNGRCCDNPEEVGLPGCTDPCDNFFIFCLRDYDAPQGSVGTVDLTNCSRSSKEQTGILQENNDDFIFRLNEHFPKSPNHRVVPNPVQLNGSNWTVSAGRVHVMC